MSSRRTEIQGRHRAARNKRLRVVITRHKGEAANDFESFITAGKVRVGDGREKDVAILRDTGANQSIVIRSALEWGIDSFSGVEASVSGSRLGGHYVLRVVTGLCSCDVTRCSSGDRWVQKIFGES